MAKLEWNPPKFPEKYAEYSWNTHYAAKVHELKGNRWTDRGLSGSNTPQKMVEEFQKLQNLEAAFEETAKYLGELFQGEVPVSTGDLKDSYRIIFK